MKRSKLKKEKHNINKNESNISYKNITIDNMYNIYKYDVAAICDADKKEIILRMER